MLKLRSEAAARVAEAKREEKYKAEIENKRKYEEARKKRQDYKKKRLAEDTRDDQTDRPHRRLVLRN